MLSFGSQTKAGWGCAPGLWVWIRLSMEGPSSGSQTGFWKIHGRRYGHRNLWRLKAEPRYLLMHYVIS